MDDIPVENNCDENKHLVNNNNNTTPDSPKNTLKRKSDDITDE